MTLEASGTQEARFIWIVSECKLSSKQMVNSLFSLHHSFACRVFSGAPAARAPYSYRKRKKKTHELISHGYHG